MEQVTANKVPTSYWVVSGLGLLWNAFGGYDYLMTRMRNAEYLSGAGDPQKILAWIDSFPLWAQVAWGLGVWGSVAGSLLMLVRSRHAATAFVVSLVGAVISFGYQLANTPAELSTTGGKVIPVVIVAIVMFLWRYCRKSTEQGIMR